MNQKLPNGCTVIAIDYHAGVVLAQRLGVRGVLVEYITWAFPDRDGLPDLSATWGGHYFGDDRIEARKDYNERVRRNA